MKRDLTELPAEVAASAFVETNDEVMWRDVDAEAAVNALADADHVILGLDVRFYLADGGFYEIAFRDFTSHDTDKVDGDPSNRLAALNALCRIDEVPVPSLPVHERRVLISWR